MHPADELDDISQMKYDFDTCHSCVPTTQASRRNFMNHAFTLIILGITSQQDIIGTDWRTWKN